MISTQPSVKKNFFMYTFLTAASFVLPMVTFPYVSRVLGAEGYGKAGFAVALVAWFDLFAQLGLPLYGVRACARVRDDRESLTRTVHELLALAAIMSAVSYAAFLVAIWKVPHLQSERPLYLLASLTILGNMLGMEWLYQGLEEYTYITIRTLACRLLGIAAIFLLIRDTGDYVLYGGLYILPNAASGIINFIHAGKYIDQRPVGGYDLIKHIKPVFVFFAMSCATVIYTNLDTVMLGFMSTDREVGYYTAAGRIKAALVAVVTSLGTVLMPRTSYYAERGEKEKVRRIMRNALICVIFVALMIIFIGEFLAPAGIAILTGDDYQGAVLSLRILLPTVLLIGITNITGMVMLVPTGREKAVLASEIAGAVTDLILNAIMIPRYAAAGAAIGTVGAEVVVLLVQVAALGRTKSTMPDTMK